MNEPVSISVITICFNNLQELIDTCRSVDQQSVWPFEHLIIDGSTQPDIRRYLEQQPQPAYRRWISEPDKGIADAFNKGIARSKGNIIQMLNAGDTLYDKNALKTVIEAFEKAPSIQWLHGKYQLQRGDQWVIIGKPYEQDKLYRGMRSICHQSMFVKKILHDKYGLYSTAEKIAMDYDFLCRIATEPFTFIDRPLVTFAPAGISSKQYYQSLKDTKRVYTRHFGKSIKLQLWQMRLKILYILLQSPAGKLLYKVKTLLKLENM
jgi:glycosyltransferase involved in cell wall biosynthesis